jgi:hypothetical protein
MTNAVLGEPSKKGAGTAVALCQTELYFGCGAELRKFPPIWSGGGAYLFLILPRLLVRRGPLRLWNGSEAPT